MHEIGICPMRMHVDGSRFTHSFVSHTVVQYPVKQSGHMSQLSMARIRTE